MTPTAPQAPSPVLDFLVRELGPVKWVPPPGLILRVERARKRKFSNGLLLGLGALACILAAVLTVGPYTYGISTVFSVLAVLLFLGCVWLLKAARGAPPFPFAVFEDGVFVPATFENIPGLQKMGPARAIRKSKIKRVEDVRREEGRAVLLWTQAGTGGVVTSGVGEVELDAGEQGVVLDAFLKALEGIGIEAPTRGPTAGEGEATAVGDSGNSQGTPL